MTPERLKQIEDGIPYDGHRVIVRRRTTELIAAIRERDAAIARLRGALDLAATRLVEHHDVSSIRRAHEQGFGMCQVCAKEPPVFVAIHAARKATESHA